ncbi:MAG: hypothetical protein JWL86_244 [Rhizobium sp.]|nr:hypothetical protein [Rhizobium sp.]
MRTGVACRAILLAFRIIAATVLAISLSNCTTPIMETPKPAVQEPPINSLALEQCIGENGQAKCTDEND